MQNYGPVELSENDLSVGKDENKIGLLWNYNLGEIENPSEKVQTLIGEFGVDYPICDILDANNSGLSTHMVARDIQIQGEFQLDGPEGDGGASVRKQFARLENPFGDDVVDGKIAAKVVYAFDGTRNDVVLFDADLIVRPLFLSGRKFRTPVEVKDDRQHEIDYDDAINAINNRVSAYVTDHRRFPVIKPPDRRSRPSASVRYSAYGTDERGIPIDNLDEVAISGYCHISVDGCNLPFPWNDKGNIVWAKQMLVENPTWLELCGYFNLYINYNEDPDHFFLEGISEVKEHNEDYPVYRFIAGS